MTWHQHVHPHGPITRLAPDVWVVNGSLPKGPLPRTMVVHKLPAEASAKPSLLIHSAVALNEDGMKKLEMLGEPRVLIVPNRFHRMDAAVFKERYPALKVLCPAAATAKVEEKVAVDGSCEEYLPKLGVTCHSPPGIKPGELCYELNSGDGKKVLVCTDILFNLPHLPGLAGAMLKWLGSTGFFGITRLGRLMLMNDRAAFRNWLLDLSKRGDISHICVGHGEVIGSGVAEKLKAAASRL